MSTHRKTGWFNASYFEIHEALTKRARNFNSDFISIGDRIIYRTLNFPVPEKSKAVYGLCQRGDTLLTYYENGDVQVSLPRSTGTSIINSINYYLPRAVDYHIKIKSIDKKLFVMIFDPGCARSRELHNPRAATYNDYVKLFPLQTGMVFNTNWTRQMYMLRQSHNMLCELSPSFTQSTENVQPRRTHVGYQCVGDFCPML